MTCPDREQLLAYLRGQEGPDGGRSGLSRWELAAGAYRYRLVTDPEGEEHGVEYDPAGGLAALVVSLSRPRVPFGPVLAYLAAYPLMKRYTRLCHYYLGVALALAPVCAWIAIRGRVDMPPIWMAMLEKFAKPQSA